MGSLPLYLTKVFETPVSWIHFASEVENDEVMTLTTPSIWFTRLGSPTKTMGVSRAPKKTPRTKDGHQRKGPKQSWQLRVGTVKRFSFADSTHKFAWQACIRCCFSEMGNLRTSILKLFFTSNPSDILPIWFFRNMFIYASQQLWLHFVTWTKKTPTTITKCIPNIPSWPTLNLSKSCILAFEPTGPIFVRQIFVRILRACRMKVGLVGWLVGWGWRVFFFGVSLKGRANLVLPKGWWDFCLAQIAGSI